MVSTSSTPASAATALQSAPSQAAVSANAARARLTGVLLAIFGAVAFAAKAIIVKLAYRYGVDAVTLIALRMVVALPFFALTSIVMERRRDKSPFQKGDWWKIGLIGFLGYYLASFLDFVGLAYITATLERLILYLNPTLVLAIGVFWFKRRVTPAQLFAMGLSYLGVAVALMHDFSIGGNNIALGSAIVFASALSYALYLVASGEMVRRVGALRLTAHASCVASFCCIAQFVVLRPWSALDLPIQVYGLSLINGLACTVLPVFAVMLALARIGATQAAQIGMMGPVSTIVLSFFLLAEPMGASQIVGTLLVLVGVFIVSRLAASGAKQ
jgi:drug/metabolite transporter (DMT)-like permease